MGVTTWIGIVIWIRIQILRYRDLEYNLASQTLERQPLKSSLKYHATIGIRYCFYDDLDLAKLHLYEAFHLLLWIGIACNSAKFGTFDLRLLTKRYDQRYLILDSVDNLDLVSLSLFCCWSNLADASDPMYTQIGVDMTKENKM